MTKYTAKVGRFLSIALICVSAALLAPPAFAQMAHGKAKFVGNVTGNSVPANFGTYWNQVTPENATKWGSVEGTQNQMNWAGADAAYNWAQTNGYKFKFHTFVWGSQFPGWLSNLSTTQQRAEIEEWIRLACTRYPNTWAIDVVNEPIKTALPWKAALGGDGATGWDWVITAFQIARTNCPNALLLINEYGTENDPPVRNTYKNIINLLKARGLIDGIGIQAHYFNIDNMNRAAVTTMLNDYATLALDVWVSELDIVGPGGDAGQLAKYQDVFPGFWEHTRRQRHHALGLHRGPDLARWHGARHHRWSGASRDDVAQGLRRRFGWPRYPGAYRARGSHGTLDDGEFHLACVDGFDGQRGSHGLSDPARTGREWRHVHADRNRNDQLLRQHRPRGEHHVPLPGTGGRRRGQCIGGVEHGDRGDAGGRWRYAGAQRARESHGTLDHGELHLACVERVD